MSIFGNVDDNITQNMAKPPKSTHKQQIEDKTRKNSAEYWKGTISEPLKLLARKTIKQYI